jgi:hypothetical protein
VRSTRAGIAGSVGCVPEGDRNLAQGQAYRVPVVGGGNDTTGDARARPSRGRPHWWVVLAVSLALMALVAAGSAGRQAAIGTQRFPATASPRHHSQQAMTTPSTLPGTSPRVPATSSPLGTALPVVIAGVHVPANSPSASTTTTSTTGGSTLGTAQPADDTVDEGYLEPPDDATAEYAFAASGATEVTASWNSAATLSLSVACPSGTQMAQGSTTVSVAAPDTSGECQATLTDLDTGTATVSYSLTIGPATGA